MKPGFRQRLTILLIALPILALCVAILRVVVANTDIVYPTPVTQSAFLKSYSRRARFHVSALRGQGHKSPRPEVPAQAAAVRFMTRSSDHCL